MSEDGAAGIRDDEFEETAATAPAADQRTRNVFAVIAIVLALVLVGLIAYLFLSQRQDAPASAPPPKGVEVVLAIDGPGTGTKPFFDAPMGVTWARDGSIYVADSGNDRICVFDPQGRFLFEFGGLGVAKPLPGLKATWRPGKLDYPLGMDTDAAGNLYVADFYNNQIQVFSPRGEPLRVFPNPNKPTGKGSSGIGGTGIAVTDVAVAGDVVYATDAFQIFKFETSGTLIGQFGKPGQGPADLNRPNGLAVGSDGTLYVADSNHNRVLAFTPQGKLKWGVGRIRKGPGDKSVSVFELPRGVAVTPGGRVLVADPFGFDVSVLSPAGRLVRTYSERGVQPGALNFPNGLAVRGDLVLVADRGNDRVQVLRFQGLR
jgi:sugar lactone lactonase YvrE